jgi:hypothetical protein
MQAGLQYWNSYFVFSVGLDFSLYRVLPLGLSWLKKHEKLHCPVFWHMKEKT